MISVHSLSGGLGCTSLAINLAYALHETWCLPTLLLDGDFSAGQIALNLNWFEAISWSDVLRAASKDAIPLVLEDPAISFDAELHVLASPHDPTDADLFSARVVGHGLKQFESRYEYIIADPAHDLRKCTVELLRNSDKILYLLSSDSTSLQLAKKALDAYATLGFGPERVELILVDWRLKNPAEVREVESIIGRTLLAHIPYSGKFNVASKRGLPLYKAYPAHPVSTLAKDLAFHLSKQSHKDGARIAPEPANGVPRPQQAPVKHNGSQRGAANSLLRRIGLTI